jgi:hypothetical protein
MDTLEQIAGRAGSMDDAEAGQHFDQVARQIPAPQLGGGIAQALRSDQTPPFPQMAAQLFGRSDPQQRAGLLGELLRSVGPQVLSGIAGGSLGGLLGKLGGSLGGLGGAGSIGSSPNAPGEVVRGPATTIPTDVAAQVTPDQVQDIAHAAQKQDPGVLDRVGQYYAQHPDVVKVLGAGALAIALGHIAQRNR